MTNFHKVTTAAAALAMGALLSASAFAAESNMTCGEFNGMDAEAQQAAALKMSGPPGGKDYEDAKARGAEVTEEGATTEDPTAVEIVDADGDILALIIEYCKGGDELLVRDHAQHSK